MEYRISKEECQKNISGVCRYCGRELGPIATHDNAGDPTYWAGCMECCRVNNGTDRGVYKIAKRLVDDGFFYYNCLDMPDDNEETRRMNLRTQVSGACIIVDKVLKLNKEGKYGL